MSYNDFDDGEYFLADGGEDTTLRAGAGARGTNTRQEFELLQRMLVDRHEYGARGPAFGAAFDESDFSASVAAIASTVGGEK